MPIKGGSGDPSKAEIRTSDGTKQRRQKPTRQSAGKIENPRQIAGEKLTTG